jgi:Cu-Zn family superoxide dismutase
MRFASLASLAALAIVITAAAKDKGLVVPLKTSEGADAGTATFIQSKSGHLEVTFAVKGIQSGVHGFHIHQNPVCDAPDFKAAGPHMGEPGMHQHENLTISPDGNTPRRFEFTGLTFGTGKENDVLVKGASIVIHEKADDMTSDPTGNAGNRIACGVIPAASAPAQP